ncbi:MAG: hypothetical protein IAE94_01170 [Chthoniobacterales bacterium]|nr:hypothetical protein [Chthoniobacterales bacterium]
MKTLASLIATLLVTSPLFAQEENLLKNPNFEFWNDTKPADWVVPTNQGITQITNASVEGVPTALQVEVTQDGGENLGEIRQSLTRITGGKYRFEGMFVSSKPGLAVFMIKLRKGSAEVKRLPLKDKSGPEWTLVSMEFEAEDADEIQILCRYLQTSEFIGGTGAFTKLKLVRID